ncbi:hypothetical protein LVJ94_35290 [Pendulispora rubella]|uniref:Uncharacterized protein n=1 Tax=Pendulispora rubella TaxID=2741070 RepID=A0ABZ2KU09_9BACT
MRGAFKKHHVHARVNPFLFADAKRVAAEQQVTFTRVLEDALEWVVREHDQRKKQPPNKEAT